MAGVTGYPRRFSRPLSLFVVVLLGLSVVFLPFASVAGRDGLRDYTFMGYGVFYNADLDEIATYNIPLDGLFINPRQFVVNDTLVALVYNCTLQESLPVSGRVSVGEFSFSDIDVFGEKMVRGKAIIYNTRCWLDVPLIYAVRGSVSVSTAGDGYIINFTVDLLDVVESVSLLDAYEGDNISDIMANDLRLGYRSIGFDPLVLEGRRESLVLEVGEDNIAYDSEGRLVGINQFYLFYPSSFSEYKELVESGQSLFIYRWQVGVSYDCPYMCLVINAGFVERSLRIMGEASFNSATFRVEEPLIGGSSPGEAMGALYDRYRSSRIAVGEFVGEIVEKLENSDYSRNLSYKVSVGIEPGFGNLPTDVLALREYASSLGCYVEEYLTSDIANPKFIVDVKGDLESLLSQRFGGGDWFMLLVLFSVGYEGGGFDPRPETYYCPSPYAGLVDRLRVILPLAAAVILALILIIRKRSRG